MDSIFGKVADAGVEKAKEWMNEDKAQKILLKCFMGCYEKNKEIMNVDKNLIMSIDGDKIKPNYRPDEIIENISDVCDKCILVDEPYKRKAIEIEIAYDYLKEASKDLLELYHVDEDIHRVQDDVLKNREIIKSQHKMVSKEISKIYESLKKYTLPLLYFVDELNNSRMYCYIVLKVNKEVKDCIMEEIEENIGFGAEYNFYESDGFDCVEVDFLEPVCQKDLREYLKVVDQFFSENGIGIFGIFTHQ